MCRAEPRSPQQGIIFHFPPKSLPINQSQVPAVEPRVVLLSLKIVSSLFDESQPRLSVSTEKKGNSSCGQPTAATHSLPIQAVGGNHFRPLSLDPRRTSFDPHRSRSLPSLSLSFGQLDGRQSSSLLFLLRSSHSETSFPSIGHHPLFRGISRYCCLGLDSRPLP